MLLTRRALRALCAVSCVALAAAWAFAWLTPGLGLQYEDGVYLVAARALATGHGLVTANQPFPIAQTKFPPLFPVLLALWSLVSLVPVWLKALPLICSAAWLAVTYRLLRRMGAGGTGAALLAGITAAAPGVIDRGTNLFADPLFALLAAASLLLILEGRPALAGVCAGLATLTRLEGVPLLAACMITLVARRRFRDAIRFTAPAIIVIAPWLGWALAHGAHDPGSGIDSWAASNIITALEPGDKLIVLLRNIQWLFQSPFAVLLGVETPIAAVVTAVLIIVCLIRRRHLLPDLFVLFYVAMLVMWIRPPEPLIPAIFPLVLWMFWRVAAGARRGREPIVALLVVVAILSFWQDLKRMPDARRAGEFTLESTPLENWADMEKLFTAIRGDTNTGAVLAANLDPLFYFKTGRKTIRAFTPGAFDLFYSPRPFVVPPDQLGLTMMRGEAGYLALTPGDVIESGEPLHIAAAALERGGVLEYAPIESLPRGYELLRVVARPR